MLGTVDGTRTRKPRIVEVTLYETSTNPRPPSSSGSTASMVSDVRMLVNVAPDLLDALSQSLMDLAVRLYPNLIDLYQSDAVPNGFPEISGTNWKAVND